MGHKATYTYTLEALSEEEVAQLSKGAEEQGSGGARGQGSRGAEVQRSGGPSTGPSTSSGQVWGNSAELIGTPDWAASQVMSSVRSAKTGLRRPCSM
ncbi:MAG TPA: hypothetical protein EYP04_02495 [Anaerolineae bacterium]|nr:hypothetical protein [Anaerolineae bacterium]